MKNICIERQNFKVVLKESRNFQNEEILFFVLNCGGKQTFRLLRIEEKEKENRN